MKIAPNSKNTFVCYAGGERLSITIDQDGEIKTRRPGSMPAAKLDSYREKSLKDFYGFTDWAWDDIKESAETMAYYVGVIKELQSEVNEHRRIIENYISTVSVAKAVVSTTSKDSELKVPQYQNMELIDTEPISYKIGVTSCRVYFLLKDGAVVYVGQTSNFWPSRIGDHKTKDFNEVRQLDFGDIDKDLLNKIESFYIRIFKPVYNKTDHEIRHISEIDGFINNLSHISATLSRSTTAHQTDRQGPRPPDCNSH